MTEPEAYARRSFVYRELAACGARFRRAGGAAVAVDFGEPEAERRALASLGLCDLSPLPRVGFRGPAALDWLRARRVRGLDRDNRADIQRSGAIAARLASTEALILGNLAGRGNLCDRLEAALDDRPESGCYRAMRRDGSFHFLLAGTHAADAMATLCGVDLRPRAFPAGSVAQTSVARMSMIVIAVWLGEIPAFHLLGDSASASYAWGVLVDAMAEFDGKPVGLDAVRDAVGNGAHPG
ncbi:MAG: hypothetical protein OXI64_11205 [Defluviicoccus sp.]|nr:hypothetical protein [Defluviicoccus sp.]